jgi:hypothetical protein
MRPVAEWFICAGLAPAPGNILFFGDFYNHWPHTGSLVGTIAKRLLLGLTAAAPGVKAGFGVHDKRMVVIAHRYKGSVLVLDDTTRMGLPKLSI